MPTIEINKTDLEKQLGKSFGKEKFEEVLQYTKLEISAISGDKITLEVKDSNRPDLLSVEGIARELKGILGKEKGIPKYTINNSDFSVKVESKVKNIRPAIACAVVKDLKLDEESIRSLIQFQEKLCDGFGRKRKEAAIGVYDFDKIKWPVTYTTSAPDKIKFVPLDMTEKLTLREILQQHEKGKEYANLIEKAAEYPILIDSEKNVLSMPPVINSEYSGKVTTATKNLFVEVTGLNFKRVLQTLDIFVAALADRGGKIFSVKIGNIKTPDFKAKSKKLTVEEVNSRLGIKLTNKEITKLLEKARYNAKSKAGNIEVEVPFYRTDVIHAVDITEDIAIMYGYSNFQPEELKIATTGSILEKTKLSNKISSLFVGLGFQEAATMTLTNKESLFKKMHVQAEQVVEIENPVSLTYSCVRNWLLPSLCEFLSKNKDVDFPQKIFEIGECILLEKRPEERLKLAFVSAYNKVNFTDARQILEYILQNLGLECKIRPCEHGSFIPGRVGNIMINDKNYGIIGEVNPAVLNSWNIKMPAVAVELDITELMN